MKLIDADVLLDKTIRRNSVWKGITNSEDKNLEEIVSELPSVNPQEPKTGHWIDTDSKDFEFHRVYKCSECGNTEIEYPESIHGHFRYCPYCGARMEDVE